LSVSTGKSDRDPKKISAMFSSIAGKYDFLNELLSFSKAGHWKTRLIKGAELPERSLVLDLCTGSGDLALGFLTERPEFKGDVIGIDFSVPMIDRAREKVAELGYPYPRRVEFLMGDALDLQFNDDKFDLVSIGFGVRNFADTQGGVREMHRVLKPGGQLNVLEFFRDGVTFPPFKWYLDTVIPWLGNTISASKAYTYLRDSSNEFLSCPEFERMLESVGFREIKSERMTFGIAHIVRARKG